MPENFSSHKAEKNQAHLNYWALNTDFMSQIFQIQSYT